MEQLMPNTYINPVMTKSTLHHSIRHLSIVSNHSHLSVGQRIRKFFTAERGDTLRHPQFSSDVIIAHLDRALKQHAVVSIMLNQPSNPFAKKLTTVTGTLRQRPRHSDNYQSRNWQNLFNFARTNSSNLFRLDGCLSLSDY
ncbi:hypothetical protein ACUKBL_11260 [Furfurilactobacillus rossiae]